MTTILILIGVACAAGFITALLLWLDMWAQNQIGKKAGIIRRPNSRTFDSADLYQRLRQKSGRREQR